MARRTLVENIAAGILTPQNLADITGLSSAYIRSLVRAAVASPSSYFPVLTSPPPSNENRIPAGPFHAYCLQHRFPITTTLALAATNYNNLYLHPPNVPDAKPHPVLTPPPPSLLSLSSSPPLDPCEPIFATASGTPASFVPSSSPPTDEMTPYQASPQTPLPLAVPPPPNPFE